MDGIESFSKEIIGLVSRGEIASKSELNVWKAKLSKKFGLKKMPSNPEILCFADKRPKHLLSVLGLKPTRSLSGIAVVAVMTAPHTCPGECTYCPGSLVDDREIPKSYTGMEPATMRALRSGFSPRKQVLSRIRQLHETGHSTGKIELIVMGGTFLSQPKAFQKKFVLSCINAIAGKRAGTLAKAKQNALRSKNRITGITFETRPDFCGRDEINQMLGLGGTRCELGVQNIYDSVYRKIRRNHTVKDVVAATQLLKDSAFKVTYHFMPGLPGSSPSMDEAALHRLFSDNGFKPDAIKLYPCLVMPETELFRQWEQGRFKPIDEQQAMELVLKLKQFVPKWVRIMRIQRDIPSNLVAAGVKKTNLRQMALQEAEKRGIKCSCIRCREAGLFFRGSSSAPNPGNAKLFVESYKASNGLEKFVSFEDASRQHLFGFLRLRQPWKPFRKEIDASTALVRELRVFGRALDLGSEQAGELQHHGLGKRLLEKAEAIALDEFCSKKLLVVSALGTKPYYFSQGFKKDGLYVSKDLN